MNTKELSDIPAERDGDVVFNPSNLIVLIRQHHQGAEIFSVQRKLKIILRDAESALLVLYDSEELTISDSFVMDITARVIAKECQDHETKEILSYIFYYNRSSIIAAWHVFPSSEYGFEELQELDFLFGQYTFYDNHNQLRNEERDARRKYSKISSRKEY